MKTIWTTDHDTGHKRSIENIAKKNHAVNISGSIGTPAHDDSAHSSA